MIALYIKICLYRYMEIQKLPDLVEVLRALAEPTRLRIVEILKVGELTVTELCQVLAMSQPRISRHLRILSEAGLLTRHVEGSWVFYRHATDGRERALLQSVLALYPDNDLQRARDRQHLRRLQQQSIKKARSFFRRVARTWDSIQRLYVPEEEIEQAIRQALGEQRGYRLVDMGTGTGRILELLADDAVEGIGIDQSAEMLAIARGKLLQHQFGHCRLLKQDLTETTLPDKYADIVTLHHVMHYLDDPGTAIAEGSRLLAPGGLLLIVDFAPHAIEDLRLKHSHRRLGYEDSEVQRWCTLAGLTKFNAQHLVLNTVEDAGTLTAVLWSARKSGLKRSHQEAA